MASELREKRGPGRPPKYPEAHLVARGVSLSPANWEWLQEQAEREGRSVSDVLDRIILQYRS